VHLKVIKLIMNYCIQNVIV